MWDTIIIHPMVNVLIFIYDLIGNNFGIAIILFTILIRAITWPLNAQQVKGAQAMQELQNDKEWQDIQKKYAKDKEKLSQEQMRIYKERGINPFASCLPTLIQFPIIIGLYQSIIRALAATPLSLLQLSRVRHSIPSRVWKALFLSTVNFCGWIWAALNLWRSLGMPCPRLRSSWR